MGLFPFRMPELVWFPRRGSGHAVCLAPEFGTALGILGLWGTGQEKRGTAALGSTAVLGEGPGLHEREFEGIQL